MAGKRSAAEAVIIKYIEKILPGSENTRIYKDLFAGMSDAEFDKYMCKLEDGSTRLGVITPNFGEVQLNVERNLDLGEELGHNFFERIWIDEGNDIPVYLSTIPYLVVLLPLRRQAQLLIKKVSIPENNKSVDDLTGQPTGASKGSKISYPEIQILAALNLDASLTEMLKYRGGDIKGFDAMNDAISKTGGVSMDNIQHLGTTVKSVSTLSTLLKAMHLDNTLL
jgi:hypothetical protein